MRSHLVSVQAHNEKQVLYNLQNIQLGSPYDVYTYDVCERILFHELAGNVYRSLAGMGTVCYDVSGTVLGTVQCSTALQTA